MYKFTYDLYHYVTENISNYVITFYIIIYSVNTHLVYYYTDVILKWIFVTMFILNYYIMFVKYSDLLLLMLVGVLKLLKIRVLKIFRTVRKQITEALVLGSLKIF